jgi:endonuclease/exonuclease/phosphatase family metal-dependent hydrolase
MPHRSARRRHFIQWLAVVLAWVAIAPSFARAEVADLRVMSFNVRVGSADDGINSWNHPTTGVDRKDLVVTTIKNYNPDILGLQEDLDYQGDYIHNETSGYTMFRRGVNADGSGEKVAILYRTNRFTRTRQGSFWLSPSPATPGSEFGSAEFPRIVNWLELSDNLNPGFHFVIMNTHWEHGSSDGKETVRLKSSALMREKMTEIAPDLPMIFTGDFNADEGSDPYRRMTSLDDFVETPVDESRFLIDTYRNKHSDSATVGTAHGFDGIAGAGRIDWILHDDQNFTTIESNIDRSSFSGRYPSDHFPINAVIHPIPEPGCAAIVGVCSVLLLSRRRHCAKPR